MYNYKRGRFFFVIAPPPPPGPQAAPHSGLTTKITICVSSLIKVIVTVKSSGSLELCFGLDHRLYLQLFYLTPLTSLTPEFLSQITGVRGVVSRFPLTTQGVRVVSILSCTFMYIICVSTLARYHGYKRRNIIQYCT